MLFGASGMAGLSMLTSAAPFAAPAAYAQQGTSTKLPGRSELVIRKGSIVTVDDKLGNIEGGDIHVRNGEIIAIGKDLQVPAGVEEIDASRRIVMPGLVETHWHTWTSAVRNLLAPEFEYFKLKGAIVPHMTPEDFYAADMLAMTEALNAGITTIHNYCHHVMSRETVEAEMRAHQDAGIRALYTFGHRDGLANDKLIDLDLAAGIQANWFGSSSPLDGRVTFGINSRGPASLSEAIFRKELDWAFERDLMVAMHAGQNRYSYSVVPLKQMGYLGPKTLIVHFVLAKPEDRAVMAETNAPLSYSVHSELRLGGGGYQAQQLVAMANDGVLVSFSFDGNTLAPIDMFETMSTAWYMGIPYTGSETEKMKPLNFKQIIEMGTINGATALGLGDKTGSLTVGKRADITLVRADDLNMIPHGFVDGMIARTARASNVDTVIADGRIMKRGGKIVGLDVEKVKSDAVRSAFNLRLKAGGRIAPSSTTPPAF
ncbi:5-methylthioadenosine/S-adenosylhomocysteine deaminase [Neorhizobium galegae bv. orientalis]|nr:5-methylthioadenosine/S-adenosylhomocysteine deaminase [Neorhizobium galegae bv. orientalis]CDZ67294.1 5-methylthioadenosine/S-adenosylhomocysteine deaminase [Neorhizobium galegae bv. orientalis]